MRPPDAAANSRGCDASDPEPRGATARGEYLTFIGIFLAGAVFRFYQIGSESIWIDEYHSITLALSGGPLQIVRAAAADVHPPLYFLLLRFWLDLFSDSLASARGFSAVVSLLALIHERRCDTSLPRENLCRPRACGWRPPDPDIRFARAPTLSCPGSRIRRNMRFRSQIFCDSV